MFGCTGLQLVEAQDYSRGIDDLRHALELNPDDYSILGNLAWALSKENRHDEAIIQYQKALAMAPLDAKLNNNLAFSLQKANRLDGSRARVPKSAEERA